MPLYTKIATGTNAVQTKKWVTKLGSGSVEIKKAIVKRVAGTSADIYYSAGGYPSVYDSNLDFNLVSGNNNPEDSCILADRYLYVLDVIDRKFYVYDLDNNNSRVTSKEFSLVSTSNVCDYDAINNLIWAGDYSSSPIRAYNPDTKNEVTARRVSIYANDVIIVANSTLYVSNLEDPGILATPTKLNAYTIPTTNTAPTRNTNKDITIPTSGNDAVDITHIDGGTYYQGIIYLVNRDSDPEVFAFDEATGDRRSDLDFALDSNNTGAQSISIRSDGNAYVADSSDKMYGYVPA